MRGTKRRSKPIQDQSPWNETFSILVERILPAAVKAFLCFRSTYSQSIRSVRAQLQVGVRFQNPSILPCHACNYRILESDFFAFSSIFYLAKLRC